MISINGMSEILLMLSHNLFHLYSSQKHPWICVQCDRFAHSIYSAISWKNTDSLCRDEELDTTEDRLETSLTSTATQVMKLVRAADQDSSDSNLNHPFFAMDCLEINGSNISNAGRDQYNVTVNNCNSISGA